LEALDTLKDATIAQIKLFIFAGHDTTSSATVFTYDRLPRHPGILARVRAEHDSVFGSNSSDASSFLLSNPQLLNQHSYTLATIKESLRIYPTVAALRIGQPDFSIFSSTGQRFPTANVIVLGDHYGVHHNPSVGPEAEKLLPERWLVDETDLLYQF
jgi:cytochrome P450